MMTLLGIAVLVLSSMSTASLGLRGFLIPISIAVGLSMTFMGVLYFRIWLLPQYEGWHEAMRTKYGDSFVEKDYGYGLLFRARTKVKKGKKIGGLDRGLTLYERGIKASFRYVDSIVNLPVETGSLGIFVPYEEIEELEFIEHYPPADPEWASMMIVKTRDLKTAAVISLRKDRLKEIFGIVKKKHSEVTPHKTNA